MTTASGTAEDAAILVVGFALVLLVLHPVLVVLILAVELAFVVAMAAVIASSMGVTITVPIRWRST